MSSRMTNEKHNENKRFVCPECQSCEVATTRQTETFRYGAGDEAADLTCQIPVRTCKKCGFQFTDDEAETIRHDTICKHLGVMTPNEIVNIRTRYNLSRIEFARLTRIGEASLSRWENAYVIQNAANDRLLYLLSYPENLERLRLREEGKVPVPQQNQSASHSSSPSSIKRAFRALAITETDLVAAKAFILRPVHSFAEV